MAHKTWWINIYNSSSFHLHFKVQFLLKSSLMYSSFGVIQVKIVLVQLNKNIQKFLYILLYMKTEDYIH